jgi:TonB-linked SusC/RagA family outer membrane protein
LCALSLPAYPQAGEKQTNDTVAGLAEEKALICELPVITEAHKPVAFGEQQPRSMTSAVSTIFSNVIEKNTVSSIEQAMDGAISGLYSLKSGGEKFGAGNYAFYVRGIATTANARPLILVDGMEVNIDLIDYNEVESISVLKDAVALAMYGMRGANGVILMTTKRSSSKGYEFKLNLRAGIRQAEKIAPRLNAYRYATLYNEALVNDNQPPMYNPDAYLAAGRDRYLYPDNDYKKEFLGNSAPFQHYNFSSKGGGTYANYFVTAGYLKQDGLFKNTAVNNSYERYNFRTNMDVHLIDGLDLNVGTSAAIDKHRFPYAGEDETGNNAINTVNSLYNTLLTLPSNAFPLFNKNGSLGGTAEYRNNPYGMLNRTGARTDENRVFNVLLKAKYNLGMVTDGLSAELSYGFENYNKQYSRISHEYAVYREMPDGSYTQFGTERPNDSRKSQLISGFYKYDMLNAGLEYRKSFGQHDVFGQLIYNHSSETVTGDNPNYKYQGVSFRAHYGYLKRYYAELTGAYQGSTNFKRGSRNGLFPALGLAWILSEEKWMNIEAIHFLKLRASYGLTGNDQTGGRRFPYRQTYTVGGGYSFGDPSGYFEGTQKGVLPNENEKWENAYKANIGLDAKLFDGLSLSVDYFNERRTDILVDYANIIPGVIGAELSKYNAGTIDNQGVEVSLNYSKKTGDWEFSGGGNLLWAKNKIIDLKEIAYQYPHQFRKGHSTGTVFGYQTNGFYTSNSQLVNAPTSQFGLPSLGDLVYINQNPGDDNHIDSRDQVALGNSFPELIYGLNWGANYKGFDLQCFMEGSSMFYVNYIPSQFGTYSYDNRWNPSNPSVVTGYPRLSIASNYNRQVSDFWQQKAYLFRFSSAELGYTLPNSITRKISLSTVRVYFNVNNLYTLTNIKERRNPEAINAGYTESPLLRTYTFGLTINL